MLILLLLYCRRRCDFVYTELLAALVRTDPPQGQNAGESTVESRLDAVFAALAIKFDLTSKNGLAALGLGVCLRADGRKQCDG